MENRELIDLYVREMRFTGFHRALFVAASIACCLWFAQMFLASGEPSAALIVTVLVPTVLWNMFTLPRHFITLGKYPEIRHMFRWRMILSMRATVAAIVGDTFGGARIIIIISLIAPLLCFVCAFALMLTGHMYAQPPLPPN